MKLFLIRFCLFILPVLLVISLAEYLLRNIPNDYSLKADFYNNSSEDIETLILGNSQAYHGLDPIFFTKKTFNGAYVIQTLDIDAALLIKYGQKFRKLKYLILGISDMSLFLKLENSNEEWRMKNYSIYYGLHTKNEISNHFEVLSLPFSINRSRLISYYLKNKSSITSSELGYGTNFNSSFKHDLKTDALQTIKVHKLESLKDSSEEKQALEQIIRTCSAKNIKVILFIAPVYSGYASIMDSTQMETTVNTCKLFQENYQNVYYFNLLNDTSFEENDYFDAVHLNEKGAKKLSLTINSIVNRLAQQ